MPSESAGYAKVRRGRAQTYYAGIRSGSRGLLASILRTIQRGIMPHIVWYVLTKNAKQFSLPVKVSFRSGRLGCH